MDLRGRNESLCDCAYDESKAKEPCDSFHAYASVSSSAANLELDAKLRQLVLRRWQGEIGSMEFLGMTRDPGTRDWRLGTRDVRTRDVRTRDVGIKEAGTEGKGR